MVIKKGLHWKKIKFKFVLSLYPALYIKYLNEEITLKYNAYTTNTH